jgi:hypothetical protein
MGNPERLFDGQRDGEDQISVPGLEQVMKDFRVAYPELSAEMIRRVLRLPPVIEVRLDLPREE